MRLVRLFLALPLRTKARVIEACVAMGVARALVLTVPFRWIGHRLGEPGAPGVSSDEPEPLGALRVAHAIQIVHSHTPWNSNCLAQALAGRWMLKRRGFPSTIYFGIAKGPTGNLEAHAWLKGNRRILTGGGELERYATVASFAD